jgi:predicted ATPase
MARIDARQGSAVEHHLRVKVLGTVTAEVDGRPVRIASRRQQAVLAVLAAEAGHTVSRERLIDAVWDDDAPSTANAAVHVHVSGLRKALGDVALALETLGAGYLLAMNRPDVTVEVDALQFAEGARRSTAGDIHANPSMALALWAGEPFDGLQDSHYFRTRAEALHELRRTLREAHIDAELAAGRHDLLATAMEAYVQEEPYREGRWRQWMLALYRAGRQSESLRVFQTARERLIADLGLEPGPALVAMERAVLAQDAALDLEPRRTDFQGAPLPVPATPTIGREDDIAQVSALITVAGVPRVTTIIGAGGVGKTRLATEVGARLRDHFDGRVAMCDLSDVAQPEMVVGQIATALGLATRADPVSAIESAITRPTLVVLDNMEHLVAAANDVRLVLERTGCHFLVTSRVPLRIRAEQVYQLASLEPGAALQLFCERLQAVTSEVEVTTATAAAIVEHVDALPLGIELAASMCRVHSPTDVARHLRSDSLQASIGAVDLPPRQRSLAAVFDWSVKLLTPQARDLLPRLGVFASAFEPADVAAVCLESTDTPSLLAYLTELVDSSLVTRRSGGLMLASTVRSCLQGMPVSGGQDRLAARHADWVMANVMELRDALRNAPDGPDAMHRFESRLPDFRAARTHMMATKRYVEAADVVLRVKSCWLNAGLLNEAEDYLAELAALSEEDLPVEDRLRVDAFRGLLLRAMGQREFAIELLTRAVEGLRRIDPASIDLLNSVCHLAADHAEIGAHDVAADFALEAVAVAERTGNVGDESMAWDLAGYVAGLGGHHELAIAAARKAVELEEDGGAYQRVLAMGRLAEVLAAGGRQGEAAHIARHAAVQAECFTSSPTVLGEVSRSVGITLGPTSPAEAGRHLAAAAANFAAIGAREALHDTLLEVARLVVNRSPVQAAQLAGAASHTVFSDNPKLSDVRQSLLGSLGADRRDAEWALGTMLTTDAAARLAEVVGVDLRDADPA